MKRGSDRWRFLGKEVLSKCPNKFAFEFTLPDKKNQLAPENGCLEDEFRFLLGRLPGRCELLVSRAGTYSIDQNSYMEDAFLHPKLFNHGPPNPHQNYTRNKGLLRGY